MAISSVIQSGVNGFQKAVSGVERSAREVASVGVAQDGQLAEPADMIKPLTDMKLYEVSAAASAKVVETGDKLLGTLLDTRV